MQWTRGCLFAATMLVTAISWSAVHYETVTYAPSSFGPPESEVEAYRINKFLFVDDTNQPLATDCEHIYYDKGENVAWLGSRVIAGLVDMYKATGDEVFLARLVVHADRIFSCRLDRENDRTGNTHLDTHRNSSDFKAWPSSSYTSPQFVSNVSHAVHSAAFVYATARFVRVVQEQNLTAFQSKASQYLPWLQESLHAFDSERNSAGLYIYPASSVGGPWKIWESSTSYINSTNVVLPMNMQTTIGLAFLELAAIPDLSAGDRADYRSRATTVASYFKSKLENGASNSYRWRAWPWGSGSCTVEDIWDGVPETVRQGQATQCPSEYWEDVSHAAVDIEFAVTSVAADLGVLTVADLKRFGNTLVDVVRNQDTPYQPWVYVDGTGAFNAGYSPDVVYWMPLAQYDFRVYHWLSDLLQTPEYQYVNPNVTKYDRDYQGYAAFLKMKYSPSLYPINPDGQASERIFVGDFAGNAAKDVLQHINGFGWRLLIAEGNNFNVSFASDADFGDVQFVGDFNGDGKSDLLQYVASQGWRVLAADPASSVAEKHQLASAAVWSSAGSGGASGRYAVSDFKYSGTGPHYDDLAYYVDGQGWRVLVSNGAAFSTELWSTAGGGAQSTERVADVYTANTFGDDLVYHTDTAWRALLSWNHSGTWRFDDYTSAATAVGSEIHSADFTNDGRDDVLRYLPSGTSGSGWYLVDSSSYGFPGFSWTFTESRWSTAGAGVAGSSLIGHFNNDTLTDLAYYTDVVGQSGWRVFINSGSSFSAPSLWSPAGPGSAVRVADFTSDGLSDLIQYVEERGGWRVLTSTGTALVDQMWYGKRGL